MVEQRDQLAGAIDALVSTAETFHPDSFLGKAADLERLGLAQKVVDVRSKWLSRCSEILGQLQGLRERCSDPVLGQRLDSAINRLEELMRSLS